MLGAAGKGWVFVIDSRTFFEAPSYALYVQWQLYIQSEAPLSRTLTKRIISASRGIQDDNDANDRFYEAFTLLVSQYLLGLIMYPFIPRTLVIFEQLSFQSSIASAE